MKIKYFGGRSTVAGNKGIKISGYTGSSRGTRDRFGSFALRSSGLRIFSNGRVHLCNVGRKHKGGKGKRWLA